MSIPRKWQTAALDAATLLATALMLVTGQMSPLFHLAYLFLVINILFISLTPALVRIGVLAPIWLLSMTYLSDGGLSLIARMVDVVVMIAVAVIVALVADWRRKILTEKDDALHGLADQQRDLARTNAELLEQREELLRSTQEYSVLSAVAVAASQSLDLDEIIESSLDKVLDLLQAKAGGVLVASEDSEEVSLAAHRGVPRSLVDELRRTPIRVGKGILNQVIVEGQPVLIEDISTDSRIKPDSPLHRSGYSSFVCVPLQAKGTAVGALALLARKWRPLTPREMQILVAVGDQIGMAIHNANLHRKGMDIAVVEERNRLAREIHDSLAQSLIGIILQLEAAENLLGTNARQARQELREAMKLAKISMEEARRSVWGLHPAPLENMALAEAIDQEIAAVAKEAGISSRLLVKGEPQRLPPEKESAVFRIAQEVLNNARKHSEARRIEGVLEFSIDGLSLMLRDDGVGFDDSNPSNRKGFGLLSMRERAELIGGHMQLDSSPGRGTSILLWVPYNSPVPELAEVADLPVPAPRQSITKQQGDENVISVLVADDHPLAREGISRMLSSAPGIKVVAVASDGEEAVSLAQELEPDVALLDFQMTGMNGIEAIAKLRELSPTVKPVILTTFNKEELMYSAVRAGARAYLLKDASPEELVAAVRAVAEGETLIQRPVATKLVDRLGRMARGEHSQQELTGREMEVLLFLADGCRNKEIAARMYISEKTVKYHVANILRKLGSSSRTEAMSRALEMGLIETKAS